MHGPKHAISIQPPPGRAPGLKHTALSHRELEVLQLLIPGMSNREIGTQLSISLNTVARHVSNIFDKLGANNRTGDLREPDLGCLRSRHAGNVELFGALLYVEQHFRGHDE
jgi:DNA-binding CsgD family transcriptional regulator